MGESRAGADPRLDVTARIHPTAIVEPGVEIGEGTSVWDNVHLRGPARIGCDCIIGEKSYVAYGVSIADRVKVNGHVYICTGVTIERGVMVSAGVVFTNDRYPRATTSDLDSLRSSDPDDSTLATTVREGATIGARAVIGPGVVVGRFAMVGMGSVVTASVPDFHLVIGHPAGTTGYVCRCGIPFARGNRTQLANVPETSCAECGRRYTVLEGVVSELEPKA
jgi:acetyltransferase-like isoleucine patch superfamily enzyme